jgi:predicted dehydrogenase/threonine dehydrogenase-like Zn-dependent dehydrogenase
MKQLIQNLKTGVTTFEEIPVPLMRRGSLLIRTSHSLVSLGTERMLVEFGKAGLIEKARQQPDKVKMVLDKIRSEGLLPTLEAVFNKLEQPLPLGYCNAGVIIEVGEGVTGLAVGDRVISNGPHAEYVCVPQNLVAKIPDGVSMEEAAFTVISAIGLQGIRLANPTLGETVVVIGLGLIGLVTAQLLKAAGCRVIGVDVDQEKLTLAATLGITPFHGAQGDVVKFVESATGGVGADAVLITASSKSNDIISQAARMSRKRGRIVLVGVIGLELSRAEFYEKELTFQVSCSYGPGRYDDAYEQRGQDYPLPFVRWTEKRNFEAILQAMVSGQLQVKPLITELVPIEEYGRIYNNMGQSRAIASLLVYSQEEKALVRSVSLHGHSFKGQKGVIGVIGAGNFTKMTMLPALQKVGASFKNIASASGVTGTALARKYGFAQSTTDYKEILSDPEIDLVMITTRHNSHAAQVAETLRAGKHVFVEKPLALTHEQLDEVIAACEQLKNVTVNVGFNRRFSPHSVAVKKALGSGPMNIIATMNAGFIPATSWVHDLATGGGRIIGEACHFIDLCSYFTGSEVVAVCMNAMGTSPSLNTDNSSILLKYADGSNAVINYFANGSKSYAKERIEIYSQERTAVIDNWTVTKGYGFKNFRSLKTSLDKGHKNQFAELITRVKQGGAPLIPFDSIVNTTRASFATLQSVKENGWVKVVDN